MKPTIARFVAVAAVAAFVGVFVALIVYVTLIAALTFILLAALVWVAIIWQQRRSRPRARLER